MNNQKKDNYKEYCIECECQAHKTEIEEMRVCLNPNCKNYQIYVNDWYNLGD